MIDVIGGGATKDEQVSTSRKLQRRSQLGAGRRRDREMRFRVSDEEYEEICEAAHRAGAAYGTFIVHTVQAVNRQHRSGHELLKGPFKGVYYDLLVMIDIFSRKVVHWKLVRSESGAIAEAFMAEAFAANGGVVPGCVHADNGPSMTSKNVAQLFIDLGITRSHSRPHVSNDNPYSEAGFKTLKYCPAFPDRFASIQAATRFCEAFFTYYNTQHRHSGIGLHTPASVHDGTAATIQERRSAVLTAAYTANPERFRTRPVPPKLPDKAWINEPPKDENKENNQAQPAA